MTQPLWPARLVKLIAGEIKRWRDIRGMSAQQLAEACEALGHPIPRSVLANLESGRRETISVPELLVLAEVLKVPPVLLVFPVGRKDTAEVEALPDANMPTWEAAKWFIGEAPSPYLMHDPDRTDSPHEVWEEWQRVASPLEMYRSHERFQREWTRAKMNGFRARQEVETLSEEERAGRLAEAGEADRLTRTLENTLWHVRQRMREHGIGLPPLVDNLRHLDTEKSPLHQAVERHYEQPPEGQR